MSCSKNNFKDGWRAKDCFVTGMEVESENWVESINSVEMDKLDDLKSEYETVSAMGFRGTDRDNFVTCLDPPPTSKRNEKTGFFGVSRVVDHYVGIRDKSKSLVYECRELGQVAGYNIWMETLSRAVYSGILTDNQKNDIIKYRKSLTMPSLLPASSETVSPTVSSPRSPSPSVSSLIDRFNKLDNSKRRPGSRVSIPPRGTHRAGGVRLRKNRKSKKRKHTKKHKRRSRKSKTKRRR